MGTIPQWIIDARKAKKSKKKAEALQQGIHLAKDPKKKRRQLKALARSRSNTPALKKHGQR